MSFEHDSQWESGTSAPDSFCSYASPEKPLASKYPPKKTTALFLPFLPFPLYHVGPKSSSVGVFVLFSRMVLYRLMVSSSWVCCTEANVRVLLESSAYILVLDITVSSWKGG